MKRSCFVLVIFSKLLLSTTHSADPITTSDIASTEKIIGLHFTEPKRELMLDGVLDHLENFKALRSIPLSNSIPPALTFNPIPFGFKIPSGSSAFEWQAPPARLPEQKDDLAFYTVAQLSALVRTRQITATELTRFFLDRLKIHGPKLHCVISLTEDIALAQAKQADDEIAAGHYRGPLHGIPYGAKDLLAAKGTKTTWGSVPFKDQVIDEDATVVQRLREAGAILIAKLSLGELAWGDVWFGGTTRNPWNPEQGSSGSSAGSAAATAAGLVPFAIGSETWGSIISPSRRCGVTGLRPTYGRVSQHGAMALTWSMDKIGPICRTAEDCALVFNSIFGPDEKDPTVINAPFNFRPRKNLEGLTIGYLQSVTNKPADRATLDKLRQLGATVQPITLPPYPIASLSFILSAEAAAAFDELTRDGRDDLLVRQVKHAWPNAWREARLIPAVEYLQANRVRWLLIQEMARLMETVDLYLATPDDENNSLLTNLTGHPCLVLPNGNKPSDSQSITLIGRLFHESDLLTTAMALVLPHPQKVE